MMLNLIGARALKAESYAQLSEATFLLAWC